MTSTARRLAAYLRNPAIDPPLPARPPILDHQLAPRWGCYGCQVSWRGEPACWACGRHGIPWAHTLPPGPRVTAPADCLPGRAT